MKTMHILKSQFYRCVLGKASKLFYVKFMFGAILSFLFLDYYYGIRILLKEKDYYTKFDFPVLGDINALIDDFKPGEIPKNTPYENHNYNFLIKNQDSCKSSKENSQNEITEQPNIDLAIFVKSSAPNFNRRIAIRNTWGGSRGFKEFKIKTFFTLGDSKDVGVQNQIKEEDNKYRDLIQGDFTDAYFNNTIKTLMSFQWAYSFCDNAKFYFFVDDDYYVSTKNLLLFLRDPSKYEHYAGSEDHEYRNAYKNKLTRRLRSLTFIKTIFSTYINWNLRNNCKQLLIQLLFRKT